MQAAMNYQRLSPSKSLHHLIEFHEVVEVDIPDPRFAFLSLNHPAEQGISIFYRLHGSGMHQQVEQEERLAYKEGKFYIQSVSTKGTVHRVQGEVGYLRTFFKPGKLERYLGTPLVETTDRLLTLDEFGLNGVSELQDQILNGADIKQRVAFLERHLEGRFRSLGEEKELIQYLTEALAAGRVFLSVKELCRFFGYSARHLRRIFLDQVGITPKRFLAMVRVKQVVQALHSMPGRSLTDLAYEFRFSDQAHFCREFKAFLGSSPGQYRKKIDTSFAHRNQTPFSGLLGQLQA